MVAKITPAINPEREEAISLPILYLYSLGSWEMKSCSIFLFLLLVDLLYNYSIEKIKTNGIWG
jgi:hypothetical protein